MTGWFWLFEVGWFHAGLFVGAGIGVALVLVVARRERWPWSKFVSVVFAAPLTLFLVLSLGYAAFFHRIGCQSPSDSDSVPPPCTALEAFVGHFFGAIDLFLPAILGTWLYAGLILLAIHLKRKLRERIFATAPKPENRTLG